MGFIRTIIELPYVESLLDQHNPNLWKLNDSEILVDAHRRSIGNKHIVHTVGSSVITNVLKTRTQ